jgi:hypothetical protein
MGWGLRAMTRSCFIARAEENSVSGALAGAASGGLICRKVHKISPARNRDDKITFILSTLGDATSTSNFAGVFISFISDSRHRFSQTNYTNRLSSASGAIGAGSRLTKNSGRRFSAPKGAFSVLLKVIIVTVLSSGEILLLDP